jgi:hypothetical protein
MAKLGGDVSLCTEDHDWPAQLLKAGVVVLDRPRRCVAGGIGADLARVLAPEGRMPVRLQKAGSQFRKAVEYSSSGKTDQRRHRAKAVRKGVPHHNHIMKLKPEIGDTGGGASRNAEVQGTVVVRQPASKPYLPASEMITVCRYWGNFRTIMKGKPL